LTSLCAVAAPSLIDGDRVLLRRAGSALELWWYRAGSWTLRCSGTDTTYSQGRLGVLIHGNGGKWNSIGGSEEPSGVPPPEQTFGTGEDGVGIHGKGGSGLFADPVNSRTGAFQTSVSDLDLPATGVPFAWSRSYTSADSTVGRLGPGWSDSYSASLAVHETETCSCTARTGSGSSTRSRGQASTAPPERSRRFKA
jgi:hypothetical protein